MPVQKQTRTGQRTLFKAIGDHNGHVGQGVKCSMGVADAIQRALALAKLGLLPVRRGYWGNKRVSICQFNGLDNLDNLFSNREIELESVTPMLHNPSPTLYIQV